MTIKKLDFDDILIERYDNIEKILRKGQEEDLTDAVLIDKNASHCDIAKWLCENPIDARGIIEEMEKLLKPAQKQLISFENIPRNNIFETAIISDIDYSAELTEILNIADLEARKAKLVHFVDSNDNIEISVLQHIVEPPHRSCFLAVDSYLYNFAYPISQFKD